MKTSQLKLSLIQQIIQLNDEKTLIRIQDFIDKIISLEDKIERPFLYNNREDSNNNKENFSEYIKEWIKEM
jgi:hypothetical protein